MRRILTFLIVASLAGACRVFTDDEFVVQPAQLHFYDHEPSLTVPTTVARNALFDVEFITYGGGCLETARNRVVTAGMEVDIYSTQRDMSSGVAACPDILRFETNRVTLTLTGTGTAVIRVHGKREPGNEILVLERQVTVGN